MTEKFVPVGIALATGILALGYGLDRLWPGVIAIAGLGVVWLFGLWRRWKWAATVGLVVCVAVAAIGCWLELGNGWMLAGVVVALCVWDLDHFVRRVRGVQWSEALRGQRRDLEKSHLQRLLIVIFLGVALSAVALLVRVRLSLVPAAMLGLLAAWGLSRTVGFLRRESR